MAAQRRRSRPAPVAGDSPPVPLPTTPAVQPATMRYKAPVRHSRVVQPQVEQRGGHGVAGGGDGEYQQAARAEGGAAAGQLLSPLGALLGVAGRGAWEHKPQ